MKIQKLTVGQMQTNCYIVYSEKEAVVVDPGDDGEYIISVLARLDVNPRSIVVTHGHFDHLMAATELKTAYGIPFFIGKRDIFLLKRTESTVKYFLKTKSDPQPLVDGYLKNGMMITIGRETLSVMETPGHTPGSISFFNKQGGFVLTGDVVFSDGYLGRTDFKYSNEKKLGDSLGKIMKFPDNIYIYPGHGEEITVRMLKKLINYQK